jgi:hypothetical protein
MILILTVGTMFSLPQTAIAGPCNPNGICKACRDCTQCRYCAKEGKGSCSVCRNQTPDEARRREAIKERKRR